MLQDKSTRSRETEGRARGRRDAGLSVALTDSKCQIREKGDWV